MQAVTAPPAEEACSLVPGPESVTWRYAGDVRVLAAAGYALLLQVAHPTVAAGVREHSNYAADPWGRLLRTLDYANLMVYGDAETALLTARRLRATHAGIRGTSPDGRAYSALEPEAFAWVHATLAEAIVAGHRRFGRRLDAGQVEQLYAEWRALGSLIGVRDGELPAGWSGFRRYFETMVAERLEDSDVVHGVLASIRRSPRPPVPLLTDWGWRVGRIPIAHLVALASVGLLPPLLRERCGLGWGRGQELELQALGAALRSLTPVMPAYLRNAGPGYLRWRGEAIVT